MIRPALVLTAALLPLPALAAVPDPAKVGPVTVISAAAASPILVKGRIRVDSAMPRQMTAADRAAWRNIFAAIHAGRFAEASSALDRMPSAGILTPTARAEIRSEEHTTELQSLMRISYDVTC